MSVSPSAQSPQESRFRTVLRVTSGNFLEMYDFEVYGFYAPEIARAFFPSRNAFVSLMLALGAFGVGFLMRPLGAIVLGSYIDRHGRRAGLILTLTLMGIGISLIAFVPGYATIGLFAPLLVLLGRLLQGFSAGVELGGVSVYLAEIAPPGQRGFYVSWQSASQQVSVIVASLFGAGLSMVLSKTVLNQWGWRIPFVFGCLIVPLLLVIRSSLQETDAFRSEMHKPSPREIVRSLWANGRIIFLGMMLVVMTTVLFYFITAYTPTFGKTALHLARTGTLIVTLCIGISNLIWLPVMGALSDRIGRLPLLLLCTGLTLVSAYPALAWLGAAPSFARLLAVGLWLSFLFGSYNGAMVVSLTEIMPRTIRTSSFSLGYSLATALFGGFTPAVSTYLIHATGSKAAPGYWLTAAAACSLTAVLFLTRTLKEIKQ